MKWMKVPALITTIALIGLTACNLQAPATPSAASVGTAVAQTLTALPTPTVPPATNTVATLPPTVAASPTLMPTLMPTLIPITPMLPSSTPAQPVLSTPTAIPPTPIVLPTATTNPNSINFVVGTTAVVERGNVLAGQTVSYTMDANANQAMILSVTSPNGDVSLGVLEQDGSILINPSHKWSHVQWLLPGTEQYTIEVVGGATSENYILTVKVAVLLYFASGATSMTVSGYTPLGYVFSYSLFCNSGQTMAVSLNVPSSTAYLDVFGIASGLLLNPGSHKNSWSGTLPQTEAYVIEVIPAGGGVVGYSLTVSVH